MFYYILCMSRHNEPDQVECKYCGEVFKSDNEMDAKTKEGVHRAEEHVSKDDGIAGHKKNDKNILDKWKGEKEGGRA